MNNTSNQLLQMASYSPQLMTTQPGTKEKKAKRHTNHGLQGVGSGAKIQGVGAEGKKPLHSVSQAAKIDGYNPTDEEIT